MEADPIGLAVISRPTITGAPVTYAVKEIFLTLQGEGYWTGRRAVFVRFAGCNLWSGREEDRANAICDFCDTDFLGTDGSGGGKFANADELASAAALVWGELPGERFIVLTGGEPMLQVDAALIAALHAQGFYIALETNGTRAVPDSIDWIAVSPKAGCELVQTSGHEMKLIYPTAYRPEQCEAMAFEHFFLQPLDGPKRDEHSAEATRYCLAHPQWRLSMQMHKQLGLR